VRARDLFAPSEAARRRVRAANRGFLSGALLALELREAREWVAAAAAAGGAAASEERVRVRVVGAGALAARYAHALAASGWARPEVAPEHAAARGLARVARASGAG